MWKEPEKHSPSHAYPESCGLIDEPSSAGSRTTHSELLRVATADTMTHTVPGRPSCACLLGQLVADEEHRIAYDVEHLTDYNATFGQRSLHEVEKAHVSSIAVCRHRATHYHANTTTARGNSDEPWSHAANRIGMVPSMPIRLDHTTTRIRALTTLRQSR